MPTKAELETENRSLKQQLSAIERVHKQWGNGALELARDNGWCETVQDFLDQEGIPYDSGQVMMTVKVTYLIEGEVDNPLNLVDDEDRNKRFVRSCLKREAFDDGIDYTDVTDSDFKRISSVMATDIEVVTVARTEG